MSAPEFVDRSEAAGVAAANVALAENIELERADRIVEYVWSFATGHKVEVATSHRREQLTAPLRKPPA